METTYILRRKDHRRVRPQVKYHTGPAFAANHAEIDRPTGKFPGRLPRGRRDRTLQPRLREPHADRRARRTRARRTVARASTRVVLGPR